MDGTQAAAHVDKPDGGLVLERAGDSLKFPQDKAAAQTPGTGAMEPGVAQPPPAASTPLEVTSSSMGDFASKQTPKPDTKETKTEAAGAQASVAVEEAKPRRRSRDKARMLARALVSDILVYNQDLRDKALEEGNLLEALGSEIKKSWELYKDKVTPEVANSTTHFRDALNEILAGGQKLF
jgi:hypothetical protein